MASGPERPCDEAQSEKEHGCWLWNFVVAADWANTTFALSRIDTQEGRAPEEWRQKRLNREGVITRAKGENSTAGGGKVREAIYRIAIAINRSRWRGGVTDGNVIIEYSESISGVEGILHDQNIGAGERPRWRSQEKGIQATARGTCNRAASDSETIHPTKKKFTPWLTDGQCGGRSSS